MVVFELEPGTIVIMSHYSRQETGGNLLMDELAKVRGSRG